MSLPAGQQQVLDRIETYLEGGEPRLRSMFAIFTRLTRDEGAPRTESLRAEGRRRLTWLTGHLRMAVAVPLILGLLALFAFMAASSGPSAPGCRPGSVLRTGIVRSCQATQPPQGRS